MSDCTDGGRRVYNAPTHAPAEDRLEITVHFHGEFNPHPIVLNRLDREVDYVEVDGERFERVRECEQEERGWGTEGDHARVWLTCGHDCMVPTVADLPSFCPHCGAKVKVDA